MLGSPETPGFSLNYTKAILDEIALEGLDGITPNDLWLRLESRPLFPLKPSDESAKSFLWNSVKRLREVSFYELPEPRKPLALYDRFTNIDPVFGVIIEPDKLPQNIYPVCKIDDTAKGVMGSCATYHTRTDITSSVLTLSYSEVSERWGHKLVVVASQMARRRALINMDVNPNLELTLMQYIVLERVGRSRYHGEITQGQESLQTVGEDAKSLFYLRKILHKHRLITKQLFHQKLGTQNACGLLLHLPRFYVERRPKALTLIEQVVNYLKAQPNHSAELNKIREDLDMSATLKKLSKTLNFQKFVKSEVVLYRTMYPDADISEWRYKGANKERSLRVLSLVNPNVEGKDVWQKYDDIYEDDDDDKCGLLDEGQRLLDRTLMWQAFSILEKKGPEGVTQVELGNMLGAPKLLARMIIRNLQKSKQVTSFMKDEGRQRTAMFALKKFDKCSDIQKQIVEEHGKLIKFIKKSTELSESFRSEPGTSSQSLDNSLVYTDSKETISETPEPCKGQPKRPKASKKTTVNEKEKPETKADADSVQAEMVKPAAKKTNKGSKKRKANDSEALNPENAIKPAKKKKIDTEKPGEETATKPKQKEEIADTKLKDSKSTKTANFQTEDIAIELKETKPNKQFIGKSLLQSRLAVKPGDSVANSVSFRLLKRTNIIMEAVNKQQVIFDTSKLSKLIYEEESKEGYDVRMDKKSLLRIINKLAYEGHLKYLTITLKAYKKEKILNFICHPTVPNDHSVIQSAVDQAKMKFHILGRETVKKKETKKVTYHKGVAVETLHESNEKNPEEEFNLKYNQTQGRVYGFKPKYMRMQVLHKYMFYLIYNYEGDVKMDQHRARSEIGNLTTVTEDVEAEMSQIYKLTLDYKMFLPPLPEHSGYSQGWALMSDLLLRMPLSLFVQVVNVMYEMPELEDYLNHPIRKHFLVKNLPLKFRNTLTYNRKYIFTIHELVTRLCCSGLIQMGPQRLKEKDQVFVFLNRRALLLDTTASTAGYHQVATDMDYPEHLHYFGNMSDVDQYWCDLWNYCMHTMLGGRMCMGNNAIILENFQTKPELSECMEPRSVEDAPLRDIGYLPGDHKGAAGFDSCTFPHLKRNWYWSTSNMNLKSSSNTASAPTTDLQPVVKKPKTVAPVKKVASKSYRMISETSSARRKVPTHRQTKVSSSLTLSANQRHIKKTLIGRKTVRLLKQRIRGKRRPYYDQVDKEALLKMSKLRVDWSAKEDNILLLCKVATLIFQFIGRKGYQNLIAVRQILHEQCPKATDKTSRACQRRLNYMMKNQQTQRSVNLCLEEMKQDTVIMQKLKLAKEEMEANANLTQLEREDEWTKHYHDLVRLLQERYKRLHAQELSQLSEGFELPDTAQELLEKYRVTRPQKLQKRGFNEIKSITDIYSGVINATILSALNSVGDKTSWSYQLFSIYQQYPDKLMRSVMAKTRADQMISMRKHYLRTHVRSGDYLPLSSSPYQLSINYINLLLVRYQFEMYGDCLKMYEELQTGLEDDIYQEVFAAKGGCAAAVVELASQEQIDFKIDIPEQIIVMDPSVMKKDESYTRIVKRYQDILSKCKEKNQVTITAVFDEAYNAHGQDGSEDEDDDEEEPKPSPGNTVAKAASRIALYFNRDEKNASSAVADTHNELQHAHDFFLVNSSRVFCQFKNQDGSIQKDPNDFVPLSKEAIKGTIKKIKRLATFPSSFTLSSEIVDEISDNLKISPQFIQEIIDFIKSKEEFGITKDDIKEVYGISVEVAQVLAALVDAQVCLQVGVNQTHWVHAEYHAPWIIKSYRLLRTDKEKVVRIDHSNYGMLMKTGGKGDEKMEIDDTDEKQEPSLNPLNSEPSTASDLISEPVPSTSTSEPPAAPSKRQRKPPARLVDEPLLSYEENKAGNFVSLIGKKMKRLTMPFDNKFKCDLSVCVRPWIRIDGSLNRRVLDKFLTSVLGHVMIYPLCSMRNLQDRFTPAFQPQHTYELVQILEEITCITVLAVKRSHKMNLFSKPSTITTDRATGLESEEDMVLEPDPLAIMKLSLFIGDSLYHKDLYSVFSSTKN